MFSYAREMWHFDLNENTALSIPLRVTVKFTVRILVIKISRRWNGDSFLLILNYEINYWYWPFYYFRDIFLCGSIYFLIVFLLMIVNFICDICDFYWLLVTYFQESFAFYTAFLKCKLENLSACSSNKVII